MKKILSFLLIILGLYGYSQDEYYRIIDWKFYPENVIQLTDSTYLTDAYPFDYNDVGAIQRVVGNYVVDFVGHRYSVIDSTSTTITVLDIYHIGQAPQTGQIARCYRSVGNGEAEYIGSIDYSPLDESSRWKLNGSDNELLWRQTIGKAENGLYKELRTVKLGGDLIESTTINQDDNSLKILNNGHGSVFSETGIAYTKIDTALFGDSTLITKMYANSRISDAAYSSLWDSIATVAPSKNAVYDKIETLTPVNYCPLSMTVNTGTLVQGSVSDLCDVGGTDVIIQEATGADPLRVTFEFNPVQRLTSFSFYGRYNGGATHVTYLEAYNYIAAEWQLIGELGNTPVKQWQSYNIFLPTKFISSGTVQVRFNHQGTGINTHQLILDYVDVNYGGAGGSSFETASEIAFVPTGNIAGTNVQAAIQELDIEKEPLLTKGNLTAGSSKVTIGGTGTNSLIGTGVSIDINEANIVHQNLSGSGTNTHAQIDNHITNDLDLDPNNENQDLSLSGNTLSLSGDASTVDLSVYAPVSSLANYVQVSPESVQVGYINMSGPIVGLDILGSKNSDGGQLIAERNIVGSYGYGGGVDLRMLNSAGNSFVQAQMKALTFGNESGSEDGQLTFWTRHNGILGNRLTLDGSGNAAFTGNVSTVGFVNSPSYKLSGVDLFGSLTTGSRTKWDGTKLIDDTDVFAPASGSANYVQVSPASAQAGDIWMNGTFRMTSTNSNFIYSDLSVGYTTYQGHRFAVNGSAYFNGLAVNGDGYNSATLNAYHPSTGLGRFLALNDEHTGLVGVGYNSNTYPYAGYKLLINGNTYVNGFTNASAYKLSGVDLFSSLTSDWVPKWDGTKFVNFYNPTTQTLSGTTPTLNATNGVNANLSISGATILTLSNLISGTSGTIYLANNASVYRIKIAGYTIAPASNITYDSTGILLPASSVWTHTSIGWYYNGTTVQIHKADYNSVTY